MTQPTRMWMLRHAAGGWFVAAALSSRGVDTRELSGRSDRHAMQGDGSRTARRGPLTGPATGQIGAPRRRHLSGPDTGSQMGLPVPEIASRLREHGFGRLAAPGSRAPVMCDERTVERSRRTAAASDT